MTDDPEKTLANVEQALTDASARSAELDKKIKEAEAKHPPPPPQPDDADNNGGVI